MNYKIRIKTKIPLHELFLFIYTCLVFLINYLPSLNIIIPYYIAALLSISIYLPAFLASMQNRKYICVILISSLSTFFIYYFFHTQFDFIQSVNEFIRVLRFFSPLLIFYYFKKYSSRGTKKILILFMLAVIGYVVINSLIALQNDPTIVRYLAMDDKSDLMNSYFLGNIGGFGFSYSIGFLIPILVGLILNTKKIYLKVIFLLLIILFYTFVITSQYTTMLLLSSIFSLLIIKEKINNMLFNIFMIILLSLLFFNITSFFSFLSDKFVGEVLSEKMQWFVSFFETGNIDALHSRPSLYLDAFKGFLQNPIVGQEANTYVDLSHSLILSILRGTGILGISSFIVSMIYSKNYVVSLIKESRFGIKTFKIIFAFLIVLSFLNPIGYSYEICYIVFLLIPILIEYYYEN